MLSLQRNGFVVVEEVLFGINEVFKENSLNTNVLREKHVCKYVDRG